MIKSARAAASPSTGDSMFIRAFGYKVLIDNTGSIRFGTWKWPGGHAREFRLGWISILISRPSAPEKPAVNPKRARLVRLVRDLPDNQLDAAIAAVGSLLRPRAGLAQVGKPPAPSRSPQTALDPTRGPVGELRKARGVPAARLLLRGRNSEPAGSHRTPRGSPTDNPRLA
jgi:hypothetical protein